MRARSDHDQRIALEPVAVNARRDRHGEGPLVYALPADRAAPAIARRHLAKYASGLPAQLVDDALVLVSELVTNAVEHGRPEIVLTIRRSPPGIGVSVQDGGGGLPAPVQGVPGPSDPRGRGLRIVDALSSAWGVEPADPPPGKIVWFEITQPPDAE